MTSLTDTQTTLRRVAETSGTAVVGLGRGWGVGSGFVLADGHVVTTARALSSDEVGVSLAGGNGQHGRRIATDPDLGLAIVEADTGDAEPLAWVPDDEAPGIGSAVIALANPGGRGLRISPGFVTREPRPLRGRRSRGGIEHTAPLPRGSAGGPLLDLDGRVVGVNASRRDGGLILAVPVTEATRERLLALARGEAVARPRLGVAVVPAHVGRRMRRAVGLPERDGALVRGVQDDSPAERAGIERGDLIVAAQGRPVDGVDALHTVLDRSRPGDTLEIALLRGVEELTVSATLEPATAAA
jgi:S1-C subfamily serine protease